MFKFEEDCCDVDIVVVGTEEDEVDNNFDAIPPLLGVDEMKVELVLIAFEVEEDDNDNDVVVELLEGVEMIAEEEVLIGVVVGLEITELLSFEFSSDLINFFEEDLVMIDI